jgi:hypothetical protein
LSALVKKLEDVYWTQNISESKLLHSKREREDGEDKVEQNALCAASPPSLYLGWLATNVCIFNSQPSIKL